MLTSLFKSSILLEIIRNSIKVDNYIYHNFNYNSKLLKLKN